MIVSTCRLDVQPDLRRAYVLHITNLEDQAFDYQVTFVMTMPPGVLAVPAPTRLDLERHVVLTATTPPYEYPFRRVAVSSGKTYSKKARIVIGGRETCFIAMEPAIRPVTPLSMFRPRPYNPLDHLEGYVSLSLPVRPPFSGQLLTQPQSPTPVRVLLNPETRTISRTGGQRMDIWEDEPPFGGGFYPTVDPPPRQTGFTFAASQTIEHIEPLHVSTGKAENELEPDGSRSLTIESLEYALDAINSDDRGDYRGADTVADEDRAGALIELLMEIGDDPEMARAVNEALEKHQARVRLRQP